MRRAAVITLSTSAYEGKRQDESGSTICRILKDHDYEITDRFLIADNQEILEALMEEIADENYADLIVTTGGTGLSVKDITPEATLNVCERMVPGIPEAIRREGAKHTDRAILTRAEAGIRNLTLIVNLPGSPRAVEEDLEAIIDPVSHGVDILIGADHDCGRK